MFTLNRLRSLWRNLVHRDRVDDELTDEFRATFDLIVDEHVERGMTRAEARRAASVTLGRTESFKEQVRDARAGAQWDAFLLDVRYGIRLMRRNPVFSLFAVASLALGIGATAAIFALFDGVVLRKLPVPEPDRLVVASFGGPGGRFNYSMPYPHFERIREQNTTLTGIFGAAGCTRAGRPCGWACSRRCAAFSRWRSRAFPGWRSSACFRLPA